MLTRAIGFIVDILRNVFFGRTLVDLKATLFEYIGPPLLIGLRKGITYKIELPEVGVW